MVDQMNLMYARSELGRQLLLSSGKTVTDKFRGPHLKPLRSRLEQARVFRRQVFEPLFSALQALDLSFRSPLHFRGFGLFPSLLAQAVTEPSQAFLLLTHNFTELSCFRVSGIQTPPYKN